MNNDFKNINRMSVTILLVLLYLVIWNWFSIKPSTAQSFDRAPYSWAYLKPLSSTMFLFNLYTIVYNMHG